jgi:hypothetical protein
VRVVGGPYESQRQALADCAEVYEAMRSKRGQMQELNLEVLLSACRDAGVELGEYDRSVLRWVASFEPQNCRSIAEIIRRAAKV